MVYDIYHKTNIMKERLDEINRMRRLMGLPLLTEQEDNKLFNKAKEKFNKIKDKVNDMKNGGDETVNSESRESIIKKMEERAKELGGVVGEYTSTDLGDARDNALYDAKRKLGTAGTIHSEEGFNNSDGSYTIYLIYAK